jgi:type II secretory pathway component PulF
MGIFSPQIRTKSMVPLCRQLATAYDAGIPILRALEIVKDQVGDKQVKDVFESIHGDVRQGLTLGDAANKHREQLGPYFVALLRSGEHGGRLDIMLRDLAKYYEDRLEMSRRMMAMMAYPIIQLSAAWFLGTFALRLLGKIRGMLSGTGDFDLGAYFVEYFQFQLKALGVFGAVFFVCAILARLGLFQYIWGAFSTFIWPMAPITRRFALARFFRSLSLLLGSGVHIVPCQESAAQVVTNPYIEKELMKTIPIVKDGSTLTEAFANIKFLTPTAREMIFIGEQSGELDKTLLKVSEYYMAEAQHALQIATKILGVAILLSVAGLVCYILFTFYSQLYGGLFDELGV